MNKRQQKKLNKNEWHPLTMRVKLKNGKIRNRTWKIGCYSHYAKIIDPPINMNLVKTSMSAVPSLCAGHWRDINDYNSQNQMLQLGYKPLCGGQS